MSQQLDSGESEAQELPRTGVDRLRPDDEIYQHVPENPGEWASYAIGPDGLPTVVAPLEMPFAPPLSIETLCCLADKSRFVLRDRWGEVIAEFQPEQVERTPDGRYRVTAKAAGIAAGERAIDAEKGFEGLTSYVKFCWLAIKTWCVLMWRVDGAPLLNTSKFSYYVEVEPIRPQCRHFARQMTDFQDNPDHDFVSRMCTARRDDGGEFLSARDAQIFGCDLRDPPDVAGNERLDEFDRKKIELGRHRRREDEVFDVEAALKKQATDDEKSAEQEAGGIFKTVE